MRDDDCTPEQLDEMGALLVAERPRPSERFAAELDARVASRFARPATASAPSRWRLLLSRPLIPAAATTLAIGLVALIVALNPGGGTSPIVDSARQGGDVSSSSDGAAEPSTGVAPDGVGDTAAPVPEQALADADAGASAKRLAAPAPPGTADSRKVERSAAIELGAPNDHIDDVAQDVLATTARFGGIVDQSSVASGTDGGGAQFALRIPSARLQPALAALSDLPDAHVLARSDEQQDVNQAYISIRRQLANARAERTGVVRALAAADTEEETLRLRARLDALERIIAGAERAQRGLDRRIDFSSVSLSVRADDGASNGATPFTVGSALHDAGRVLEVAAGVLVIAAAALLPLALLLACALPLAHTLRRRRREQALDSA